MIFSIYNGLDPDYHSRIHACHTPCTPGKTWRGQESSMWSIGSKPVPLANPPNPSVAQFMTFNLTDIMFHPELVAPGKNVSWEMCPITLGKTLGDRELRMCPTGSKPVLLGSKPVLLANPPNPSGAQFMTIWPHRFNVPPLTGSSVVESEWGKRCGSHAGDSYSLKNFRCGVGTFKNFSWWGLGVKQS